MLVTIVSKDTNEDEVDIFDFASFFLFLLTRYGDSHAFRKGGEGKGGVSLSIHYGGACYGPTETTTHHPRPQLRERDRERENMI